MGDATAENTNDDRLLKTVIEIISEELSIPKEAITKDSNFVDDLGCEDLDLLQVVIATELELSTAIRDDEVNTIRTVNDFINILRGKKLTFD